MWQRLRERRRAFEAHAGEPMKAGALDLVANLRTGAAQPYGAAPPAQAARKHRQVDHQRDVREDEFTEVHDEVAAGLEGTRERLPPPALGGSIFVSATPQHGGLFAEIDDRSNLVNVAVALQG